MVKFVPTVPRKSILWCYLHYALAYRKRRSKLNTLSVRIEKLTEKQFRKMKFIIALALQNCLN